MKMTIIFVGDKLVHIADIGEVKYGGHVGLDKQGNLYTFCWVNNKGYEYNNEKDGDIRFWTKSELDLLCGR